ILHYGSDPAEPLLDAGTGRVAALPDAPVSPDDVSFAAFGNSDCQLPSTPSNPVCPELLGSNAANDVIARAIAARLAGSAADPSGPAFSLFTGDVGDAAGNAGKPTIDPLGFGLAGATLPLDPSAVHERWAELIGDPLLGAGLPVFGA